MKKLKQFFCFFFFVFLFVSCENKENVTKEDWYQVSTFKLDVTPTLQGVQIKWKEVPSADRYELYYTNDMDFSQWNKIETFSAPKSSYEYKEPKKTFYAFKVVACSNRYGRGNENIGIIDLSDKDTENENSGNKVMNLKVKPGKSSMTISWSPVSDARYYILYVKNKNTNDEFELLKKTTSTSFVEENPVKGKNVYQVQSCDSDYKYGEMSDPVTAYFGEEGESEGEGGNEKPSFDITQVTPTGLYAYQDGNSILVTWNKVEGAMGYKLWYSRPAPYAGWRFDQITSRTSQRLENLPANGTYSFYVQALDDDYNKSRDSETATCYFISTGNDGGSGNGGNDNNNNEDNDKPSKTQLDAPTLTTYHVDKPGRYYMQISYIGVALAYDYELYRSTSRNYGYVPVRNASYEKVGEGETGTISVPHPTEGVYYYKLKAIPLSYLGIKESDYSNVLRVEI